MKKYQIYTIYTLIIITQSTISCKKFLEIPGPSTSINQDNVYQNDFTAAAVLTGLYAKIMSEFFSGGITSISLIQELSADNLILNNLNHPGYLNWWRNAMTGDYSNTEGFKNYFSNFYPRIYITNAAIEGLNKSTTLTPSVKRRLLGEAHFLRALYYFYLVNIYGGVPLVVTTDYTKNVQLQRSSIDEVYQEILEDLKQATNSLDDRYVGASITSSTTERLRPNLSAAQALLARVQLFVGNFSEAEKNATTVINKSNEYALVNPDSVFMKNSKETIWALQPVNPSFSTDEASVFILNNLPGSIEPKYFYLSPSLITSFENNDKRLQSWIRKFSADGTDYYYAAKYKSDANSNGPAEYCIVLRFVEQYLIRAEARLNQNNIDGALEDINIVRKRAELLPYTSNNTSEIRTAILKERRVELFTEWGHRWFDLKRSGTIDESMATAMLFKGGTWASYKQLFPIPNDERLNNSNLSQNPGYGN